MSNDHPSIVQITGRSIVNEPLRAVSILLVDESECVLYSYEPTEVQVMGDMEIVMKFAKEHINGDFSLYIPVADSTVGHYMTGVSLQLVARKRSNQYLYPPQQPDHLLSVFTSPPQCVHGYNPYAVSKELTSVVDSIQTKNPILHATLSEFSVEELGLLFVSALFTIPLDRHRTH